MVTKNTFQKTLPAGGINLPTPKVMAKNAKKLGSLGLPKPTGAASRGSGGCCGK